jgi:glutamine cyclotransferase
MRAAINRLLPIAAPFVLTASIVLSGCDRDPSGQVDTAPAASTPYDTSRIIPPTPVYGYRVVNEFPHDSQAFTQGLIVRGGAFLESTGRVGTSSLRKVEIESGRVLRKVDLPPPIFAEGLTEFNGKLYQLSWQNQLGFIYDAFSFQKIDTFRYYGEGWGITHDSTRLIMSDGSDYLRILNPSTLKVDRTLAVVDVGRPVENLNELEWVDGEVWANVYQTSRIARIDPGSGLVKGWIDLSGILRPEIATGKEDVLNGIAYDAATRKIYVTGKLWPRVFEIELVKK